MRTHFPGEVLGREADTWGYLVHLRETALDTVPDHPREERYPYAYV